MVKQIVDGYRKLKEYDAFGILLRPRVMANAWRHARELRERPIVMRSHPPGIEIELTNRCNLACIQCLRSGGLRRYELGDITLENFQKILPQFPHLTNLCLNGFGEPLLHRQFTEIVSWTHRRFPWVKIYIYSNGMKLDEARAESLLSCGLTEINVSIDAARPDTYERVRRGGSLPVVHANIRSLLLARARANARFPLVGVNYVMLNQNEGELVPFIEQAADLGVDFVNCISYATYDWGFKNRRTRESYLRELDAAERRLPEVGLRCRSFPTRDFAWTDAQTPFDCSFFWGRSLRVTFDGSVTLGCCTPFKETFSYGNLLKTPFDVLWNGPEWQRHRQASLQHRPPVHACASCDRSCKSFFATEAIAADDPAAPAAGC